MLREATYPPAAVNVLGVSSESMAAFQVFLYGRFWVFTEGCMTEAKSQRWYQLYASALVELDPRPNLGLGQLSSFGMEHGQLLSLPPKLPFSYCVQFCMISIDHPSQIPERTIVPLFTGHEAPRLLSQRVPISARPPAVPTPCPFTRRDAQVPQGGVVFFPYPYYPGGALTCPNYPPNMSSK